MKCATCNGTLNDDGELEFSRDVAHILDDVRSDWGMRYPFEK